MKLFIITISVTFMLIFSSMAYAKKAVCVLPKGCKFIESEFSTGGGNKVSYIMEVTCKMPDGSLAKYLSWEFSVGGLFGMGRISAPKKIIFVPGNNDSLECNY